MRTYFTILIVFVFSSCANNGVYFEKSFYEKVSGINFPKDLKAIETFDNGEWLTGTVFTGDTSTLKNFVITNHLDPVKRSQDVHLLSIPYLKENIPDIELTENIFFLSKSSKSHNWAYLVDLNTKRLWVEISYPDWGGK